MSEKLENNEKLAKIFNKMADALEYLGEIPYKVSAYRKAARTLENLDRDVSEIEDLESLPGIGEGIAKKIKEFLETGKIEKAEEIFSKVPEGILDLMQIPNLGPKTLALLHKEFGVKDLETLKAALENKKVLTLFGMGEKKVENIKKGIELFLKSKGRYLLGEVYPLVNQIIEFLKEHKDTDKVIAAGSFRRFKETVGDVDILVTTKTESNITDYSTQFPKIEKVLVCGPTKSSFVLKNGLQVDIRVIPVESMGAAMQYFTGSKQHNIHLRKIAKEMGLKISEYGVFKDEKFVAGRTEEEVYGILNMQWIPPEIREDEGEIELALEGKIPELVKREDVLGDLHVHSDYSDGQSSILEIKEEGKKRGYSYVAICDHSQSAKYAKGLSIERLLKKREEIKKINERGDPPYLIFGAEVDILPDGRLDYPDEVLKEIDFVVVSIHTGFRRDNTDRIVRAFENPFVHAFSHPTGRLIGSREPYEANWDLVFKKAKERGIWMEINSYYERLDLSPPLIKKAKKYGLKFIIGTDAHHYNQMWMLELGVGTARRGYLTKDDIINTLELEKLLNLLKSKRTV
ncbi:MAG: DNA polymerase/3'-5' exonuclease PolX [Candidatus Hydrothermales bacterium]